MRGKLVVVTGAGGSLGSAVAATLAAYGARPVLTDVAPLLGSRFPAWGKVDLADAWAAAGAMRDIVNAMGRIDALVNVAGTFRWETVEGGSVETWDLLYRVNLRTAVVATQAALPYLPAQGRVVNIGAAAAGKAALGMGAYAASKSGVARLTEALAEEMKGRGITVNAVLPGIIDTPQNRQQMPEADHASWVRPESIAEVVAFLLSSRAQEVTGALIPVCGRV